MVLKGLDISKKKIHPGGVRQGKRALCLQEGEPGRSPQDSQSRGNKAGGPGRLAQSCAWGESHIRNSRNGRGACVSSLNQHRYVRKLPESWDQNHPERYRQQSWEHMQDRHSACSHQPERKTL